MVCQQRFVSVITICFFFIIGSSGVFADSLPVGSKGIKSQSLDELVNKIVLMVINVDNNLLNEENVQRIEASKNYEAIAVLHRSISDRDLIEEQINQGRFNEAYAAMKAIENRLVTLIKLSWANEYKSNKRHRFIESEYAISSIF